MWRLALICLYSLILFYLFSILFGLVWAMALILTGIAGMSLLGLILYALLSKDEPK
jgi:hypothetical protein